MGWFGRDKKTQTNSVSLEEEKAKKFLSDYETAEKIVNEYGGVMEMTSQMVFGAPKSLLPQPKDKIKQAIIMCLLGMQAQKVLDSKTFELFKCAYSKLASFLDEEEAKTAVIAMAEFNSGDPERIASPIVSKATERFALIVEESRNLGIEFDSVVTKFGIQLSQNK